MPLEFLQYPFMQRALIAGILLGIPLALLGAFVLLRRMAFFGEGVAHASLAGIALAILAGVAPLPVAIAWAVVIALAIYRLERSTRLSSDTLIGILFTASMALGVIAMSYTAGYQPELLSFLFGSILGIRTLDLWLIAALAAVITVWIIANIRTFTLMSLSEESARAAGMRVSRATVSLYVSLAVATVLGVKILGIVLVSALLILPAATSRLLAGSFKSFLILSVLVSEIAIISGLVISYFLDWPSGATIVLAGSLLFSLAFLMRREG